MAVRHKVNDHQFEQLLRAGDPLPDEATLLAETEAAHAATRVALPRAGARAGGRSASGLAAAFDVFAVPWGLLHVAVTDDGVVSVELEAETPDFVDRLARRLHGRVVPVEDGAVPASWRDQLAAATAQIGEYLAGRRTVFGLPVDLRGLSAWDRRVLAGAASLGFGEVTSYGDLARRIGKPGAARAVGGALGRNPVPIVIPCHRVLAADGTLGGYGGSGPGGRTAMLAVKRRLLRIEGAWSAA
jgi:methylated-DNA-[protein]-cysteine S-methyltransferase